ncbi:hypothetical protein QE152_g15744 [Popillia japonica]|uniref:Uncharacterized protein n=1 Tax=Popillia japonica TaxID=7064 RepID=A0AAW1L4X8_POPJA
MHCPCDDSNNLGICYVETSTEDRNASTEDNVLRSSVWSHLGPPTKFQSLQTPAISARKIDIMRALLSGKAKPATSHLYPAKSYCEGSILSRCNTRVHYEE